MLGILNSEDVSDLGNPEHDNFLQRVACILSTLVRGESNHQDPLSLLLVDLKLGEAPCRADRVHSTTHQITLSLTLGGWGGPKISKEQSLR